MVNVNIKELNNLKEKVATCFVKKPYLKFVIILLALILIGALNLILLEVKKVSEFNKKIDRDSREIIKSVGKLIILPSDKIPNIVKITDIEKFKKLDPLFYKDTKNGDYVLFYDSRAIIYNPSKNIIVDVAPLFGVPKQ